MPIFPSSTDGDFRLFDGPALRWGEDGLEIVRPVGEGTVLPRLEVVAVEELDYRLRLEAAYVKPDGAEAVLLFNRETQRNLSLSPVGAVDEWQVELRGQTPDGLRVHDRALQRDLILPPGRDVPLGERQITFRTAAGQVVTLQPGLSVNLEDWRVELTASTASGYTLRWTRDGQSRLETYPLTTP
ncbi:MAG: hypothetical protein Q7P63_04080 [Verrucomicrobiota bacterium JB022]|nr:hypothetical protein [Verrucomicrobiota bacterium JB022]